VPTRPLSAPLVLAVATLAALVTGAAGAAPAPAGVLPARTVETKVVLDGHNQLVMRGDVTPGAAGLTVVVQRKACRTSCAWTVWERLEARAQGRFRSGIEAPRHGSDYYRARVPQHHGYATSYSRTWRTWTD
jgi:hypothetical protein